MRFEDINRRLWEPQGIGAELIDRRGNYLPNPQLISDGYSQPRSIKRPRVILEKSVIRLLIGEMINSISTPTDPVTFILILEEKARQSDSPNQLLEALSKMHLKSICIARNRRGKGGVRKAITPSPILNLENTNSRINAAQKRRSEKGQRWYFEKRNSLLLSIEGIYKASTSEVTDATWEHYLGGNPNMSGPKGILISVKSLHHIWSNVEGNNKPTFTRWLCRIGIPQEAVTKLATDVASSRSVGDFKISCRYKDIINMSKTNAWDSCLAKNGAYQSSKNLHLLNSNMAVVMRVENGKLIWRVTLFSVTTLTGETMLLLTNSQGLSSVQLAELSRIIEERTGIKVNSEASLALPGLSEDTLKKAYSYGSCGYNLLLKRTTYRV